MGENSNIVWCHNSQNFWMGCDKVAAECSKCYIDRILLRQGREPWGQLYRTKTWREPLKWQKKAEREGVAIRVFTCSLSDFFHVKADPWRAEAWQIIRDTPNLIWLVLTKRPERIMRCLPPDWPYPNVWPGVSTGCLQTLNKMDTLRKVPIHEKAVRWISAEPLLENIVREYTAMSHPGPWANAPKGSVFKTLNLDGFGWVVTGGESGSGTEYLWDRNADWRKEFHTGGRRTMELEWAANLRDATKAAGLPFLFKQITAPKSGVGADALGREWHEYPSVDLPWAA